MLRVDIANSNVACRSGFAMDGKGAVSRRTLAICIVREAVRKVKCSG